MRPAVSGRATSRARAAVVISPKKLIEVALPLDAINAASAREKSIRHGHPSTLHLWWARRPLAAARAVIFSQLVHDPEDLWRCQNPGVEPNPQVRGHWTKARARLFKIIEDLVKWENTTNEAVLNPARDAIRQSWRETCTLNKDHPRAEELFDPDKMPGLHDPFAGGGTIPLEAQRLGLEAHASDLNPVAVLINKAMIEIPPKFAGRPPVFPGANGALTTWTGAAGLAEDVRRYGQWMRDEAFQRIGHLYPPVEITPAMVAERPDLKQYQGEKLTVIAWLWARTVKSPNPAFADVDVPLASTFILSSKEGKQSYVQPVKENGGYRFTVKTGTPPPEAKCGTTAGKRAAFRCIMSDTPVDYDYIRDEGKAGRMGQKLMAVVAEGTRGRVYLAPTSEHIRLAFSAVPVWKPDLRLPENPRDFKTPNYGLMTFADLFTPRQLVALNTFSDLVAEGRERIRSDAVVAGMAADDKSLAANGSGTTAYAEAVSLYLGIAVARYSNAASSICSWNAGEKKEDIRFTFSRQALPMTWDFAEGSPFSDSSGNFADNFETWLYKTILNFPSKMPPGRAVKEDATSNNPCNKLFHSTDPPYYDNIGYADLSDFFYIWLRRALRAMSGELLNDISTPKERELVANPYRHGGKSNADRFFLAGMTQAISLPRGANPPLCTDHGVLRLQAIRDRCRCQHNLAGMGGIS